YFEEERRIQFPRGARRKKFPIGARRRKFPRGARRRTRSQSRFNLRNRFPPQYLQFELILSSNTTLIFIKSIDNNSKQTTFSSVIINSLNIYLYINISLQVG
ncbi:hypothetical protein C0J52_07547, partial [Blattella germanica]